MDTVYGNLPNLYKSGYERYRILIFCALFIVSTALIFAGYNLAADQTTKHTTIAKYQITSAPSNPVIGQIISASAADYLENSPWKKQLLQQISYATRDVPYKEKASLVDESINISATGNGNYQVTAVNHNPGISYALVNEWLTLTSSVVSSKQFELSNKAIRSKIETHQQQLVALKQGVPQTWVSSDAAALQQLKLRLSKTLKQTQVQKQRLEKEVRTNRAKLSVEQQGKLRLNQQKIKTLEKRIHNLTTKIERIKSQIGDNFSENLPALRALPAKRQTLVDELSALNFHDSKTQAGEQALGILQQTLNQQTDQLNQLSEFINQRQKLESAINSLTQAKSLIANNTKNSVSMKITVMPDKPPMFAHRAIDFRTILLILIGALIISALAVKMMDQLFKQTLKLPSTKKPGANKKKIPSSVPVRQAPISPSNFARLEAARELSIIEVETVFQALDSKEQVILHLVLSGLRLNEIKQLKRIHFDWLKATLTVKGRYSRVIPLPKSLLRHLNAKGYSDSDPWPISSTFFDEALFNQTIVTRLEHTSLRAPETITYHAIQFTYWAFLLRQGLPIKQLNQITGVLSNDEQLEMQRVKPLMGERGLAEVNMDYLDIMDFNKKKVTPKGKKRSNHSSVTA